MVGVVLQVASEEYQAALHPVGEEAAALQVEGAQPGYGSGYASGPVVSSRGRGRSQGPRRPKPKPRPAWQVSLLPCARPMHGPTQRATCDTTNICLQRPDSVYNYTF